MEAAASEGSATVLRVFAWCHKTAPLDLGLSCGRCVFVGYGCMTVLQDTGHRLRSRISRGYVRCHIDATA